MFKRMQVGDVVVLRSDEDAQLLRAIEGNEVANWAPGNWKIPDRTLSVKKISDSKYDYSWCEKLDCPKWWSTYALPRVRKIPEGYEPAFEGEEIKVGWMFGGPSDWKAYDSLPAVTKVSSGHYHIIKPKGKPVATQSIPDGYESLKEGDTIRGGDLHYSCLSKWEPVVYCVGDKYRTEDWAGSVIRKKPDPQLAHGPIPDGYEMLGFAEPYRHGDIVWNKETCTWEIARALRDFENSQFAARKKPTVSTMETATQMGKNQFVQIDSQEKLAAFIKSNPKIASKAIMYPHGANGQLKSGTFKKPFYVQWYVCDYICQWERPRESDLTEYFIPVGCDNPVVTTMEHQDGATTTTVSFGGVGSKFEKNGREYEVTRVDETVGSSGLRQLEIQATAKPTYGQSPMKPAMDALDAVAKASKMLESRPSVFITSPEMHNAWTEAIEKKEAESKTKRAEGDAKLSNAVREKVNAIRKQEIASIVQSVVEKLS